MSSQARLGIGSETDIAPWALWEDLLPVARAREVDLSCHVDPPLSGGLVCFREGPRGFPAPAQLLAALKVDTILVPDEANPAPRRALRLT